MADIWSTPTDEQNEQCVLVQNEIVEVVNRLCREGIDPRVVIAGMGAATCDTITSVFGITAVSPWFLQQAIMINQLTGKPQH